MTLKKFTTLFIKILVLAVVMNDVSAEDVAIVGSIKQVLKQSKTNPSFKSSENAQNDKIIRLLRIQLSDEARDLPEAVLKRH